MSAEDFVPIEDYEGPHIHLRKDSYWFLSIPIGGDYKQCLKILINLTQKGYVVFSPLIHSFPQIVKGKLPTNLNYWENVLDLFLLNAKGVIVVKSNGWGDSKETKHVMDMASRLELPVVDYDSISTVGLH